MLPDAFTAKTLVTPTPCIIWTGALNSNGYGCFSVDCVSQLAHRVRPARRPKSRPDADFPA